MEKDIIKAILRENFVNPILKEEKGEKKKKKKYETEYAEIQRKLEGTMLKQSQVMAAAGLGDPNNASDRSLFSKKLRKEKNDEGGIYMFSKDELAAVYKVINNPTAYLTVKKASKKTK